MSKKDYIQTAGILADFAKLVHVGDEHKFGSMVSDFADMFAKDNPAFNRAKFIEASYGNRESAE
jgi:hypothetical protein